MTQCGSTHSHTTPLTALAHLSAQIGPRGRRWLLKYLLVLVGLGLQRLEPIFLTGPEKLHVSDAMWSGGLDIARSLVATL